MSVPKEVSRLIEKFDQHLESYRSGKYNEAQLRNEFLNPFFKALGWDMDNDQGLAEAYKDVVHEDAIRIGGAVKAPDYCFRIGGTRKFFLEAKKPSVDIGQETSAAYQLRRYAWSAKLPLSILSDFEEFAVYDCRVKPNKSDSAATARVFLCRFQDYPEKWEWISSIFSKVAILKGSFDKYAEENKAKRGTSAVDDDFLATIERWRSELAKNIALRNSRLSQRELNFAVQRIIDRIIFLRICEDRGSELYGRLQGLTNGPNIYPRLCEVFEDADGKYNSGLFHFKVEKGRHEPPDEITLGLGLDDKLLRDLLRGLYYPESPYEFTVISSDILGQAYEQFLGKVIRLTEGHHAVVEDKPEVKKAGGVYYTPTYIVDYIVKQTIAKITEGKTPKQASKLRILDPACGSGSFLINAYQFLLDWHHDWYFSHKPETWTKGRNPVLVQTTAGWKLTIAERKRILLDNIYGVDIDPQAVEVTKLSLLLKVLEGESEQTIQPYLRLFSQRALPDLGNNIKCGNSLIGPDFYKQIDTDSLNNVEILKINPFDWHKEFPIVFSSKNPGFDVIVGNPPYIRVRILRDFIPPQAINYLESQYKCATHVWDIYLLFFERAAQLTHVCGRLAFIVPIQTLHQPNCESLRSLIINNNWLDTVADLSSIDIFSGAIVKNCIIVCDKSAKAKKSIFTIKPNTPIELSTDAPIKWPYENISSNPGLSLKLDLLSPKNELCKKIKESSFALGELCYVTFGLRSCAKRKGGGGKERLITSNPREKNAKPYLEGREISRYSISSSGRFIRYIPEEMYSPRTPALFETRKIVSQTMLSKMRIVATLDENGFYVEQSLLCVIPHGIITPNLPPVEYPLEILLALMNSRLQTFYFSSFLIDYSLGGGLIHATPGTQAKFIIPRKIETKTVDLIVTLVKRLLELNRQLLIMGDDQEREVLLRHSNAIDEQIDQTIYSLYGLTDEEIRIVEEATTPAKS